MIQLSHIQRDMNKIRADRCLIYFYHTSDREVRGLWFSIHQLVKIPVIHIKAVQTLLFTIVSTYWGIVCKWLSLHAAVRGNIRLKPGCPIDVMFNSPLVSAHAHYAHYGWVVWCIRGTLHSRWGQIHIKNALQTELIQHKHPYISLTSWINGQSLAQPPQGNNRLTHQNQWEKYQPKCVIQSAPLSYHWMVKG